MSDVDMQSNRWISERSDDEEQIQARQNEKEQKSKVVRDLAEACSCALLVAKDLGIPPEQASRIVFLAISTELFYAWGGFNRGSRDHIEFINMVISCASNSESAHAKIAATAYVTEAMTNAHEPFSSIGDPECYRSDWYPDRW